VHPRAAEDYRAGMGLESSVDSPGPGGSPTFATTRWSAVIEAGQADSPRAAEALEALCQTYWYPLYAYVRRNGHRPEDAQDLTQEFFARLLAKGWLADADRTRGRFRTFLLTALKRFLANEWHREHCLKRGGANALIPLDAGTAEERYALEPLDLATPDALYERRWAMTLLERALARLRTECEGAGEGERFEALQSCLLGERSEAGYATLAARFDLTESGLKSTVRRFRLRFRELLRAEIADTVASDAEVELELHQMQAVLSGA
jgi:DNA-directed RNA polymerase specialized sigma24 family protein